MDSMPPEVKYRKDYAIGRLTGKKDKESVGYRQQQNLENTKTCFDCEYYSSPGKGVSACEKVAGLVEARDVCDLWKTRSSNTSASDINVTIQIRS